MLRQEYHRWVVPLGRFGYMAKGVVYILIGVLAAMAAFGYGGKTTDSRGVLREIMTQPFGKVLLAAVAIGLAGYAIWRLVEAIFDPERRGTNLKGMAKRVQYGVIGFIYAGLTLTAVKLLSGSGGGSSAEATSQGWTATVLSKPLGQWIVGAVGLGILLYGLAQFYEAWSVRFFRKLETSEMTFHARRLAKRVGQMGLTARGIVWAIIGTFLMQAAVHANAGETRGLRGAMQSLAEQPFGSWLMGLVAVGLAMYGVYSFFLARYRRMVA